MHVHLSLGVCCRVAAGFSGGPAESRDALWMPPATAARRAQAGVSAASSHCSLSLSWGVRAGGCECFQATSQHWGSCRDKPRLLRLRVELLGAESQVQSVVGRGDQYRVIEAISLPYPTLVNTNAGLKGLIFLEKIPHVASPAATKLGDG